MNRKYVCYFKKAYLTINFKKTQSSIILHTTEKIKIFNNTLVFKRQKGTLNMFYYFFIFLEISKIFDIPETCQNQELSDCS